MIFHLGALIRLNETGYLSQLKRVSGVSGGSITAALIGMKWKTLNFKYDVAGETEAAVSLRHFSIKDLEKWMKHIPPAFRLTVLDSPFPSQ